MKRIMKKYSRIIRMTALCLLAAMLFNLAAPAPEGASAAQKEEVVYVRLNNDGSVDEIYVVNSFALDGDRQIVDYGNYAYVQNLSNMDSLHLKDGAVTIDAHGGRLYYEGFLLDAELPWTISITYRLNGRATPAEDLGGKSGRLDIEIATQFNPLGSRAFFDRYCLQVAVSLSSDVCRNIRAEGGTVAAAGGNKQINYIVLPGKEAVMKISADVEDFKMPAITIAGVTMNMEMDFGDVDMADIRELIDGLMELDDGVKELLEGVFDMCDGVADLYDGVVEFADGMDEFNDGVEELSDGVADLADGTEELLDGVRELEDGVAELADGMDELADGVDELVDGIQEFDDGVAELRDGVDELHLGVWDLLDGTDRLYSGFESIVSGAGNLNAGLSAFAQGAEIAAGSGSDLCDGFAQFFDGLILFVNGVVNEQLAFAGIPPLTLTRENYQAVLAAPQFMDLYGLLYNYEMLLKGLGEYASGVSGLGPGAAALSGGMAQFTGGLSVYQYNFRDYLDGVEEFYIGMDEFVEGVDELRDGSRELLDGAIELRDGVWEFRDGVIELHDGVADLYDGAAELNDGVIELRDGVIDLHDGSIELRDGAFELRDGIKDLLDGTYDLYDGVDELKDGTGEIRDNTETLDTDIVDGIKDTVEEMMGGDGPVWSFVSLKNGAVGAVQFVMQTEGVSRPESPKTTEPEAVKSTFWQRFLALFGIAY